MQQIKATIKHGDINEAARRWKILRHSTGFAIATNAMYIWMLKTHRQLETADDEAATRRLERWLTHGWDKQIRATTESKQVEQSSAAKPKKPEGEWIQVTHGKQARKVEQQIRQPVPLSNHFEALKTTLEEVSNVHDDTDDHEGSAPARLNSLASNSNKQQAKTERRRQKKHARRMQKQLDEVYFDCQIERAEDERTDIAKNANSKWKASIAASHDSLPRSGPGVLQKAKNLAYATRTLLRRAKRQLTNPEQNVRFSRHRSVRFFSPSDQASTFHGGSSEQALEARSPQASATWYKRHGMRKRASQIYAAFDTGADNNFVSEQHRSELGLPDLGKSSKLVRVANGGIEHGKVRTQLPFEGLSEQARRADSFDTFHTTLISGQRVVDDGNKVILDDKGVKVYKSEDVLILVRGKPIMVGKRDERGRFQIPLMQVRGQWQPRVPSKRERHTLEQANSVYDLPSTEQAIKWMHAVCGYPVKSTWLKAIKAGNFHGWPLLTARNVKKYYPETDETAKGHLNQTRKNVRSTKFEQANTGDMRGKKVRDVYMKVYDTRETSFSDQTGRFPTRSQRGNKYIMVMVEMDSNAILVEPMTSRKDKEMQRAYRTLMLRLKRAGIVPKKHVIDNEVSEQMKAMIRDEFNLELQLASPGMHRVNAAEVAIRNFKCHFLSVLAGTADDFPPYLWDRLLPQTEITLNLLRQSNATPKVSAYAHLCGPFDYNKMPLAPMGCKVQVHEKTDKRGTWSYHTVDGWYLSTSPEHYRAHNCHIKATRSERVSDTVQFQHKNITNPEATPHDKLMQAMYNHAKILRNEVTDERQLEQLSQLMQQTQNYLDRDRINVASPSAPPLRVAASGGRITRSTSNATPVPRVESPTPRVERTIPRVASQVPRVASSKATPTATATPRQQSTPQPTRPVPRVANSNAIPTASAKPSKTTQTPTKSSLRASTRRTTLTPGSRSGPSANTRSRSAEFSPPAANTRSRRSATPSANAVETRGGRRAPKKRVLRRLTAIIEKVENEVYEALAVMDQDTGKLLKYRQLLRHPKHRKEWSVSAANEFGRLANGVGGRVKGTNTFNFINKSKIPKQRMKDITYGQFVCSIRPEKKEPLRVRLVVGGNKINYPGEVATPTAEMLVAKILLNSVVSTKGAKFMTMDISNFYLNTPLTRPEYVRIQLIDIPDEIIDEYNLRTKATDGAIYVEINKGMYGLPQAGLLANQLLEKRLNKHGYHQSKLVPGLWTHEWRPIQFTLVVDDFGVKYVGKEHAKHLQSVISKYYPVTTEWSGDRYIGIQLEWDYKKRQVHLSMPGYAKKALKQFQHDAPAKRQDSPFPYAKPIYGAKQQFAKHSTSPPVDSKAKKFIQQVCGKFLYLGRAVDSTLLMPISAIASQQANPTEETLAHTKQLLDYIASQEEAVLTYTASDMILAVHSDASYLNESNARSRAGGHFFLSTNNDIPRNNGAILNIAHIIKHVMSSATEAELAALYIMAREAVYIRIILEEMGHKQPPTPMQTDNAMAEGVINSKVQPKRTKAMDMRFHWLRDRECQEQFRFYWRPGKSNYADYWTKHHAAKHHKHVRREFLTPFIVLEMVQQKKAQQRAMQNK